LIDKTYYYTLEPHQKRNKHPARKVVRYTSVTQINIQHDAMPLTGGAQGSVGDIHTTQLPYGYTSRIDAKKVTQIAK
jgi:hypothetical protein